jgi:hypothetical protein
MSNHHLSDGKSSSIEWRDFGTVGIRVLKSFSNNSRINERDDTAEGGGGWESGVGADGRNINHEWVEVLLSCNKTTSGGDSSIAGAKLGDDEIGLAEFAAGVGGSEKELDGSSSKGCSLTGYTNISMRNSSEYLDTLNYCSADKSRELTMRVYARLPGTNIRLPRSVRAPMAAIAPLPCSCPKRASATAARRAMKKVWVYIMRIRIDGF